MPEASPRRLNEGERVKKLVPSNRIIMGSSKSWRSPGSLPTIFTYRQSLCIFIISGLISSALGQIQQSSSPAGESLTTASLAAILSSTDADGIGPSGSDGSSSGGGTTTEAQTIIDVQEGDRVKLECRFSAELAQKASTLYWIRTNRNGHDNVAIGETPYQAKYSVDYRPTEGVYDLTIQDATYDRDNGQFKCQMKEGGSGLELHSVTIGLTVLLEPSPPSLDPATPTATEGRLLNLTCSSLGGSPPPQIHWYNEANSKILDATLVQGRTKDDPTQSILSIMPTKEDDGTSFRCTVWNRALGEGNKMESKTAIFVNYFPRVTVGPENPLKVEKDDTAQLECTVDSKPSVSTVKWTRNGRYIDTHFKHTIPRVTLKDSGSYICSADNGLGQAGKAELQLDVLHAPIVTLPGRREAKEGEDLTIECEIVANPRPASIQWFKEGDESFHQNGPSLRLDGINAQHNGKYVCSATNYIQPTGKDKSMRVGNATIEINVRHQPGEAFITPEKPVAVDGKSVTLKCGANPPGYPEPSYRWWKEGTDGKTQSLGEEFVIDPVHLNTAGRYFCQPTNELGDGSVAGVLLEVHQAPKMITQLQPTIMKRAGDTGFHITCSAVGKPKPVVRWFKDGDEIHDFETNMFQMSTSEQEAMPNMAYNVLSTLKYIGPERISNNQLMPTDRGHYTCQFSNSVGQTETTMLLRIEHSPVVVHQHNKVAFDNGETAFITCRMQAYPAPRFDWSFGNNILSDQRMYETNLTALDDDIYESTLTIFKVTDNSYGDYICKGMNSMGAKRTIIKLQAKGKPDRPINVRPLYTNYDMITLTWDEGFDGGYNNTMFTVQYRKEGESAPRYKDCRYLNPCNLTTLEQHTQYYVRVKANNIRGESKFSREVTMATKVDVTLIPTPSQVHYAKTSKTASFQVVEEFFPLVAKIELENEDGSWTHYDEIALEGTVGEMAIESKTVNNLRVRLCLETNAVLCGAYADAQIVEVSPTLSSGSTPSWLIALIIILIVLAVMIMILVVKCCCCNRDTKAKAKERPNIVHATQPPPYSSYGLENKGVDTVKDTTDGPLKNNIYSVQNGGLDYNNASPQVFSQDQSNSNSANGGSVNSQDSLWNVKHGALDPYHPNNYNNINHADFVYDPALQSQLQQQHQQQQQHHHPHAQAHGFQGHDDYAHYPYPDEYLNERNQQYLMEQQQYGHMDSRQMQQPQMDGEYSPYGDVSGLPDPYIQQQSYNIQQQQHQHQQQQQQQQQHMGHHHPQHDIPQNFDDSQDDAEFSGGRGRRVIREIIV